MAPWEDSELDAQGVSASDCKCLPKCKFVKSNVRIDKKTCVIQSHMGHMKSHGSNEGAS